MAASLAASYSNNPHFFSELSREAAEKKLAKEPAGVFLVRKSSRGEHTLCISLRQAEKTLHFLVLQRGLGFGLDPDAWKMKQIGQETYVSLQLLISRLKQVGLLTRGLTAQDFDPSSSSSCNSYSDELPGTRPVTEKSVSVGKEDLKKALVEAKNSISSTALEAEYKGMLAMMIRDKKLSSEEISTLHQWKNQHGLTQDQHDKILASLGISAEQYEKLKDFSADTSERELCVICLEAQKAAVFIDCGHMATCFACAEKLPSCPMCRKAKTKVIRVFQ